LGTPGNRKSQCIKYIARESFPDADYAVYYKNIPLGEIKGSFINQSVTEIMELQKVIEQFYTEIAFQDENNKNKKIIFILQFDEADSLFTKRISDDRVAGIASRQDINTCTNGLIQLIDELAKESKYQTVFMLTTNNLKDIDPAIIRPGRFNNHFKFGYLKKDQAEGYLEWTLNKFLLGSYLEIDISPLDKENILKKNILENKTEENTLKNGWMIGKENTLENRYSMTGIEVSLKEFIRNTIMGNEELTKRIKNNEFSEANKLSLKTRLSLT
jgi:SpoVK/Ycf46/Vps4 family AAA+-type ATPase